ncbi:hypothetical protein D187_003086 [Cystobacter fuscus DSM 2262]|uniref:Uncharacterized protein n=1 Tax=Cystobacter fuscus (strain ATCC 25194 / DSM 2262 / NBRC 100088 / M29) TaxID=1242864 RepID=S9PAA0_CYSF2|nr:hypothetical protein [Cystobacter fuscus]EPX59182.1 hypothetical protein D187_003086 [Cystobacter fuscus DSM 2262]
MAHKDVPNIVVMVGGTTDPGNTALQSRSASYQNTALEKDPDWYWRDNPELLKALKLLQKKYTNLHLFTAHGWTGDNAAANRKVAGAYLANRLCGGAGQKAYYKALLNSEVSFHLIGHSHGGNVINELTREAAHSKAWPKHWKIRSITYLSTPFFTQLHPVDTGAFDKDCRILNVFCRYDLTQRVIADFSLEPMTNVLKLAGVDQLTCKLQCLTNGLGFDRQHFESLIKSVSVKDMDPSWKIDLTLMLDKDKGTWFYGAVLRLLGRLNEVFVALQQLVNKLNVGLDFPVPKELDPSGKVHRQVMSAPLAAQFRAELNKLQGGLKKMEAAFKTRLASGQFPLMKVFDDLHVVDFLEPLVKFISVDRKTLQGPLWNLVVQLLREQMFKFDNTSAVPDAQLRNTPFASRIVPLDISIKDPYSTKGKDVAFNKFIKRLEGIEARYAQTNSVYELRDLLFTLLAHVEPMRAKATEWASLVDWYEGLLRNTNWLNKKLGGGSAANDLFLKFVQVLENYALIIKERDCGQLEVPTVAPAKTASKPEQKAELDCTCKQKTPAAKAGESKPPVPPPPPPMGSLGYLAVVAHSTSRQALYLEVQQALEAQFNTLKR